MSSVVPLTLFHLLLMLEATDTTLGLGERLSSRLLCGLPSWWTIIYSIFPACHINPNWSSG